MLATRSQDSAQSNAHLQQVTSFLWATVVIEEPWFDCKEWLTDACEASIIQLCIIGLTVHSTVYLLTFLGPMTYMDFQIPVVSDYFPISLRYLTVTWEVSVIEGPHFQQSKAGSLLLLTLRTSRTSCTFVFPEEDDWLGWPCANCICDGRVSATAPASSTKWIPLGTMFQICLRHRVVESEMNLWLGTMPVLEKYYLIKKFSNKTGI